MDIQSTKVLVAVLFFVISFFFGMLPLKLYTFLRRWEGDGGAHTFVNQKRHSQVNIAVALCQSFGGGVLFATCFLHMAIEVYKSMEELKSFDNLNTEYPLSQLIICAGFFLVYFVEELSHWIITRVPQKPCPPKQKKFNNFIRASVSPSDNTDENVNKPFMITGEYEKETDTKSDRASANTEKGLTIDEDRENIVFDTLSMSSEVVRQNQKNSSMDKVNMDVDTNEELELKEEVVEGEVKTQQQVMRCFMGALALSFHAAFEGLAIGLQKNPAIIWYLFLGTIIHSATILFCVGLELLLARSATRNMYLIMFGLAIASPIGVILGLFVTIKSDLETKTKAIAVVLLEGLSAGMILYITFFEVLNREKERRVCRVSRAVCILGGFSLMAFLQYLEVQHS